MKRPQFITIFIACQILLIFLQIHKHTQFIKQSYRKQYNEKLHEELAHKKQQLTQELYAAHNPERIEQFARESLQMKNATLAQVKRLGVAHG